MPLIDANQPAQPSPDMSGVGFLMTTPQGMPIGVIVTHDALQDIDSPPPRTEAEHVARLERHRHLIASIASQKFDAGHSSAPIRITSTDISS